ncbi:MAG: DEAD/DEAH box helicase [Saprospiraceae bacterium]|nr:DEAD/DEAH box helicase [Saprospiraceae bacterium]
MKNKREILDKLNISELNEMQENAQLAIHSSSETILLSPTGTGKTLAFLLPLISEIDMNQPGVQLLIVAPSRELAIQIEQVTREMGTGIKTNVVYGGRPISKDKLELKKTPGILIGTPGRIADHMRRNTFDPSTIRFLVLDEFDKSLEIGFEEDMGELCEAVEHRQKIVLTSATKDVEIPEFVGVENPLEINFLDQKIAALKVSAVVSPQKDKLETLVHTIRHLGNQPGIIFCNYKDSIQRVSKYLEENEIDHGTFYGGMEQIERERALIKFRNGTHQLLIATDLAARGIDVPEIKFIIHYHLPHRSQEFTHRNGRTARMHKEGQAIVLKWEDEVLPDFIGSLPELNVIEQQEITKSPWQTLFISGGRKDKISKGDIVGLFVKQADVKSENLGMIELKNDCSFVAVRSKKMNKLIEKVNGARLKKKKVKVYVI